MRIFLGLRNLKEPKPSAGPSKWLRIIRIEQINGSGVRVSACKHSVHKQTQGIIKVLIFEHSLMPTNHESFAYGLASNWWGNHLGVRPQQTGGPPAALPGPMKVTLKSRFHQLALLAKRWSKWSLFFDTEYLNHTQISYSSFRKPRPPSSRAPLPFQAFPPSSSSGLGCF